MKTFNLHKLKINPDNPFPFSGTEADWQDFKDKLQRDPEFCVANKIAYDSSDDYLIIAGNKRAMAFMEMGMDKVPENYVIDVKDWPEDKRRRYIFASNYNVGSWQIEYVTKDEADEWNIEYIETEEFEPSLEPTSSLMGVDEKNIEDAQNKLEERFNEEPNMRDTICPNCAHIFKIMV